MAEGDEAVRCPKCGRTLIVPEDWRLATCPTCGTVVTRMGSDAAYD